MDTCNAMMQQIGSSGRLVVEGSSKKNWLNTVSADMRLLGV